MRLRSIAIGAGCGLLWWGVALVLGARQFGVVGGHPWAGPAAGGFTGVVVAALSTALYPRLRLRDLIWYSPLSVYLAIAIFGPVAYALRVLMNDVHPDQIRWAAGAQSVAGMWWGVTMLVPVALVVQLLAYANHRLLWIVIGSHHEKTHV